MLKREMVMMAVIGFVLATGGAAQAALMGELGILDLVANPINPVTGVAWAEGDQYHLAFITSETHDAVLVEDGSVLRSADSAGAPATLVLPRYA